MGCFRATTLSSSKHCSRSVRVGACCASVCVFACRSCLNLRLQVLLWRIRGKVPLAVDITSCLIEINIRSCAHGLVCRHNIVPDQCKHTFSCFCMSRDQKQAGSSESSETVRLEYSMALVRMVNGISDKAQKGKTATSVSSNAAAAGTSHVNIILFVHSHVICILGHCLSSVCSSMSQQCLPAHFYRDVALCPNQSSNVHCWQQAAATAQHWTF